MKSQLLTSLSAIALGASSISASANAISGRVTNQDGKPMEGVMLSAFDDSRRQSTSVFSQKDGSFRIDGLRDMDYKVRVRLMGQLDQWHKDVKIGTENIAIKMKPASGEALEVQRPATSGFSMLPFDNMRDKLNFKMMCSYCHQIGTVGFRTPEKPVDWETMITRMDGYGGLYHHTKQTIVQRLIDTYKDDAVLKWPTFVPPPPPSGMATKAKITAWEVGPKYEGSFHDLELGPDGLVYLVNISKHRLVTVDPKSGERQVYKFPRGSYGPHSVELANDGHMWFTMCATGQMAKFDLNTKEFLITSSAEAPAKRGSYPHTLRIDPKDPEGLIWYTDAGRNSVFWIHPKTLEVKEYKLLSANQAKGGGKGESRGITPYGLDYSPVDGMIWYSKLNGNRIGRIDPKAPDGDIKEWNPPFRGPRRLHCAPDGMVWVPGFASGVFAKFDPKTEEWTVYPLPDMADQIPYALNVDPKGNVWICGTGNDTLYRFDPRTEYLVEFRLPFRVSYTREIEFDEEGNVWTSTSGPARHMETACGHVIKLELLDDAQVGGAKIKPIVLTDDQRGVKPPGPHDNTPIGQLLAKIEATPLPAAYQPGKGKNPGDHARIHQAYVDKRMGEIAPQLRGRVSQLWEQKRKIHPDMENAGASFVKIMEFVARGEKLVAAAGVKPKPKPKPTAPPTEKSTPEEELNVHRLQTNKRARFDAFAYVNRIPRAKRGESPTDYAGRIFGRLANQEGRILLKLPPGMDRNAYDGFKTFLGSEGNAKVANCVSCHAPNKFTDWQSHVVAPGSSAVATPALRNLAQKKGLDLEKVIRQKIAMSKAKQSGKAPEIDDAYARMNITEADIPNLVAFLNSLNDVSDAEFRNLIVNAKVMNTSQSSAPDRVSVSVSGLVRFEGAPPKRLALPMTPESRKLYPKDAPALDESILVGKSGGLQNVFVYVKEGVPEREYPVPAAPALVDQQKSMFRPRVQGVRVGQNFVMRNSDPIIHNVRSLSKKNRPFYIAQPAKSPDRKKTFSEKEGPITIKCDFHPWMTAHFFVMDHPFYAVTGEDGRFAIKGLPPGEYKLGAWHEELGEQEMKISVGEKQSEAGFTFKPE